MSYIDTMHGDIITTHLDERTTLHQSVESETLCRRGSRARCTARMGTLQATDYLDLADTEGERLGRVGVAVDGLLLGVDGTVDDACPGLYLERLPDLWWVVLDGYCHAMQRTSTTTWTSLDGLHLAELVRLEQVRTLDDGSISYRTRRVK